MDGGEQHSVHRGEGLVAKLVAGQPRSISPTRQSDPQRETATRTSRVERWHHDAKIFTIFEGSSEISDLVVARTITGLPLKVKPGSVPVTPATKTRKIRDY